MKKKFRILILSLFVVLFLSGCDSENISTTVSTDIGLATIATDAQKAAVMETNAEGLLLPDVMDYEFAGNLLNSLSFGSFDFGAYFLTGDWSSLVGTKYPLLYKNHEDLGELAGTVSDYSLKIVSASLDIPFDSIENLIESIRTGNSALPVVSKDGGVIEDTTDLSFANGDYSIALVVSLLDGEDSLYDLSIDIQFNISNLEGTISNLQSTTLEGNKLATFKLKKFEITAIFDKAGTKSAEVILSVNETNNVSVVSLHSSISGILDGDSAIEALWGIKHTFAIIWGTEEPFDVSLVAHDSTGELTIYSFTYSQLADYSFYELIDFGTSLFFEEKVE